MSREQSKRKLFFLQILTEPVTPQLQLLLQHTMTSRPQLQDCLLHPILLTHPHSPATSVYRPVQAPQLTPATSRSCRLKSSACLTAAAGQQQALSARPLSPRRRATAPLGHPLPRTQPAHPWPALLQVHPRVMAPRRAACKSHQVVKDPLPLLQVSILITQVYRKLWTRSFRADHLSTT